MQVSCRFLLENFPTKQEIFDGRYAVLRRDGSMLKEHRIGCAVRREVTSWVGTQCSFPLDSFRCRSWAVSLSGTEREVPEAAHPQPAVTHLLPPSTAQVIPQGSPANSPLS